MMKRTYQVMEDISLMEMNGDECLELPTTDLCQVSSGHIDESIQHLQEHLISTDHYLLVSAGIAQSYLSIPRPDELDPQNTNLQVKLSTLSERTHFELLNATFLLKLDFPNSSYNLAE